MRSERGFEPHDPKAAHAEEITRAAPARDDCGYRPARIRTRTSEVGARRACRLHHGSGRRGRPASNGRLRAGDPALSPSELHPRMGTSRNAWLESNQRPLPSHGSALRSSELQAHMEPPAGVEPTPRPYDGRVLAVDTTEAKVETAELEPAPPRCKRGALPAELRPQVELSLRSHGIPSLRWIGCGRVESNHHSPRQRLYRPRSSPMLGVRRRRHGVTGRIRTGTAGITTPDARRYTTVTLGGDGGARTRDLSADNRVLCSSELRPRDRLCYAPRGARTEARRAVTPSREGRSRLGRGLPVTR
jgi:hypothetical protein